MRILLLAPVIFPCGGDLRYQGIERLAYYWACQLHRLGHQVSVASATGSLFPRGIQHIEVPQGDFVQGELNAYGIYRSRLWEFDVLLDFSHSHWAMRNHQLPAACWIWHTPSLLQPPLPEYNVLALSEWQAQQLLLYQKVNAQVFDCHCGPVTDMAPGGDRFIFIGRMTPTKGALEAIGLCQELGSACGGLDIIGGLGPGDNPAYLEQVKAGCGNGIEYYGQVDDEAKNRLLSRARALIYPINYPHQAGEAHSHKSVDACLLGTPVVAFKQGALSEVIEDGVDGFLATSREEFKAGMLQADTLDREFIRARAIERWSVEKVVARALPLMKELAQRRRW